MIDFLTELRPYIVYVLLGFFTVAITSWVFFLNRNYKKKYSSKTALIGFIIVFTTGLIVMWMNVIIATALRSKLTQKVEIAQKNNYGILINGQENKKVDKRQLLSDLSKVNGWYLKNHSSPKTGYLISIISKKDTFNILLERDSKNAEKYWTYLPNHNYELELDLLHTRTLSNVKGIEQH